MFAPVKTKKGWHLNVSYWSEKNKVRQRLKINKCMKVSAGEFEHVVAGDHVYSLEKCDFNEV